MVIGQDPLHVLLPSFYGMGLSQTLGWRLTLRSTQRVSSHLSSLLSNTVSSPCNVQKPIPFLPMSQARHLLKVPLLRHYKLYEEKGISGLYDKQPFMLAWTNYQSFLIKKLNALTAGMSNTWPEAPCIQYLTVHAPYRHPRRNCNCSRARYQICPLV